MLSVTFLEKQDLIEKMERLKENTQTCTSGSTNQANTSKTAKSKVKILETNSAKPQRGLNFERLFSPLPLEKVRKYFLIF